MYQFAKNKQIPGRFIETKQGQNHAFEIKVFFSGKLSLKRTF